VGWPHTGQRSLEASVAVEQMKIAKQYILDTNVLLADPQAIYNFAEHEVVIPIVVLEELDKFKSAKGELGYNARQVTRELVKLVGDSKCATKLKLNDAGGTLTIESQDSSFSFAMLDDKPDNYILGVAIERAGKGYGHADVILVTKDINLFVKAKALGIEAQDYKTKQIEVGDAGKILEVHTSTDQGFLNLRTGADHVPTSEIYQSVPEDCTRFVVHSPDGSSSLLAKTVTTHAGVWLEQINSNIKPCGIKPRNAEQRFLVDALTDPNIDCVVCNGVAGTGKTLLSLACGIEAIGSSSYRSVLITKAITPVGNDIGFLPGSKDEKLQEWVKPYYDNAEYIGMCSRNRFEIDRMFEIGRIEVEALTYMRGRSLMGRYIIVDECQNLTPGQIKTIATRVANDSKLVLLGDLQQIDNPYLSMRDNGLAYAMLKYCGLDNVAILLCEQSERGEFATQSVALL
jgi:PhoH-like ATPase